MLTRYSPSLIASFDIPEITELRIETVPASKNEQDGSSGRKPYEIGFRHQTSSKPLCAFSCSFLPVFDMPVSHIVHSKAYCAI